MGVVGDSPIEGLTITDEKKEKKKEETGAASPGGGDFLSRIRKNIREPNIEDSFKERYKKALQEASPRANLSILARFLQFLCTP